MRVHTRHMHVRGLIGSQDAIRIVQQCLPHTTEVEHLVVAQSTGLGVSAAPTWCRVQEDF